MVSVQFKEVGQGTCSWCRKEKAEVFLVVMGSRADRAPKQWCWSCLRNSVRLEVDGGTEKPTAASSAPAGDDPSGRARS